MLEADIQRLIQKRLVKRGALVTKFHGGPYTKAGVLDLTVCYKGHYGELEVKRPEKRNNLTKLQRKRLKDVQAAGGFSEVVCSPDEAEAVLDGLD